MIIASITTWVSSIPPVAVAVLIALVYVYFAGGRWTWPMLLDAGLLGLYLWRPHMGMLTFALVLGSVRHVPALAREVVVIFRLHEFDGWTIQIVLFILPALRIYTQSSAPASAPRTATGATVALPPLVRAAPAPTFIDDADMPMLLGEGLRLLNADPTAPHIAAIGPTQQGKTTFIGVVLSYRPGTLVITTPKGEQFDPWFGATVVRTAMDLAKGMIDWSPIERAISGVHYEMLRRNTPGAGKPDPITLVIDELTTTIAQIPTIAQKVIDILTMGAGSGVRLVAIATDVNVRGWRMDGRRDVFDNLVFAKVEDGRKWSIGRLDANWRLLTPRALDTQQVLGLAADVSLAGRGWQGLTLAPAGAGGSAAPDPLLGGLLAGAGRAVGVLPRVSGVGGQGGGAAAPAAPGHTHTQTNGTREAEERIAMYMVWRAEGIKKEQARTIRHTTGAGLDDREWAEAGKRGGV